MLNLHFRFSKRGGCYFMTLNGTLANEKAKDRKRLIKRRTFSWKEIPSGAKMFFNVVLNDDYLNPKLLADFTRWKILCFLADDTQRYGN